MTEKLEIEWKEKPVPLPEGEILEWTGPFDLKEVYIRLFYWLKGNSWVDTQVGLTFYEKKYFHRIRRDGLHDIYFLWEAKKVWWPHHPYDLGHGIKVDWFLQIECRVEKYDFNRKHGKIVLRFLGKIKYPDKIKVKVEGPFEEFLSPLYKWWISIKYLPTLRRIKIEDLWKNAYVGLWNEIKTLKSFMQRLIFK